MLSSLWVGSVSQRVRASGWAGSLVSPLKASGRPCREKGKRVFLLYSGVFVAPKRWLQAVFLLQDAVCFLVVLQELCNVASPAVTRPRPHVTRPPSACHTAPLRLSRGPRPPVTRPSSACHTGPLRLSHRPLASYQASRNALESPSSRRRTPQTQTNCARTPRSSLRTFTIGYAGDRLSIEVSTRWTTGR